MNAAEQLAVAEQEAATALAAYETAREAFEDAEAEWGTAYDALMHFQAMAERS